MNRQEALADLASRIEIIVDYKGCAHLKKPHSRAKRFIEAPKKPAPHPPSKSDKKDESTSVAPQGDHVSN